MYPTSEGHRIWPSEVGECDLAQCFNSSLSRTNPICTSFCRSPEIANRAATYTHRSVLGIFTSQPEPSQPGVVHGRHTITRRAFPVATFLNGRPPDVVAYRIFAKKQIKNMHPHSPVLLDMNWPCLMSDHA